MIVNELKEFFNIIRIAANSFTSSINSIDYISQPLYYKYNL